MSTPIPDVIDHLLGVDDAARLRPLRDRRAETRQHAQASYEALFPAAQDAGTFELRERAAVAAFVAALHQHGPADIYYTSLLASLDGVLAARAGEAAREATTQGPYGHYRETGLQEENTEGLRYSVSAELRGPLGDRLGAALEHAHLLVFRPREASAAALRRLEAAGWQADEIVTLSQLVSFLAFQIRVVAGLALLARRLPAGAEVEEEAA